MKKIILTTGPSFLHDNIIKQNHEPRYIYRINGAHGTIRDIEYAIQTIRKQIKKAEILIDLPGNKIRTANLTAPIKLLINKPFFLEYGQTNFPDFYQYIKKGDVVYANDSIFRFTINEIKNGYIKLVSHSNGVLTNNKGMYTQGINEKLPFLLTKDLEIIKLINKHRVKYAGLSFVRNAADIKETAKLIKNSTIIAKIETRQAVDNLSEILKSVDHILIDRGDLSTHIGLARLAYFQRFIIEKALARNKKVFLATQFLKNMETMPIPTIAEVIDLTHTLKQGIYGIQLSEEIAIGKYPLKCLELIKEIEKNIDNETI